MDQAKKLCESMKQHLHFQRAVDLDLQSSQALLECRLHKDTSEAIVKHSKPLQTQMWDELKDMLIALMGENGIPLLQLNQPQSDKDFEILEAILNYISHPQQQPKEASWKDYFEEKGKNWLRGLASSIVKFLTGIVELPAFVAKCISGIWRWFVGIQEPSELTKGETTKSEDEQLDFVAKIARKGSSSVSAAATST